MKRCGAQNLKMAKPSTETTRIRLIEAALGLFARNGLDGVSLRAVNQAANAKNSGATHYHFRNRLGLIKAMVEHVHTSSLDEVDTVVESLPLREDPQLLAIARFFGPILVMRYGRPWGEDALGFLSQLIRSGDPEIQGIWEPIFQDNQYVELQPILDAFPDHDEITLKRRLIYGMLNVVHGLANDRGLSQTMFGDVSLPHTPQALVDLLEYIRGGLDA